MYTNSFPFIWLQKNESDFVYTFIFITKKKVFIFILTELSGQSIVEIKPKFKNGTTMVPFKFYDFQIPHTTQFLTNCGVVLYVTQRSLGECEQN